MKTDFKRLAADLLARASSVVPTWLPEGKQVAQEWIAKNPRRDDRELGSFKINLSSGVWSDFAAAEKGSDLISLWAYIKNLSQGEAARELSGDLSWASTAPQENRTPGKSKWEATGQPGPREATAQDMTWPDRGEVSAWWAVRDLENRPLFYDVRFQRVKPDGTTIKDVLSLSWCRNSETGASAWRFKAFPEPRPLFGFPSVELHQAAPVVVVEGAKCRQALADLLGDRFPVVSWAGGAEAVRKSDWRPLAGRKVLIWPDNDRPGFRAAQDIGGIVSALGSEVAMVLPHPEAPEGWDCADLIASGADRATVLGYMKGQRRTPGELLAASAKKATPTEGGHQEDASDRPFRVLGHDRDLYYYLPRAKGQIVALRTAAHTKTNLISLAPIHYWESEYATKRGPSWTAAQDALMREADRRGPFSASRVRGRGAWRDGQDLIVHTGDRLLVNGKPRDPVSYVSQFIYERGIRLHNGEPPATAAQGAAVLDLFKLFPWGSPLHGVLAAGWAFLAPICGALYWRPHIWITGEPGSGKTWFTDNVIAPFVRDFGIIAQGSTSAAGVRQALGAEALPIVFDEAESNDRKGQERIAEVLELMRQSSTSGEALIIKGSAQGDSVSHAPSSSWCLSSVVTAIRHQADQGRVSILELQRYDQRHEKRTGRNRREQHRITSDLAARLFTARACQGLRSRAFTRIRQILEAVEVFREVAADHLGSQRIGDQLGSLLAGAWCLASDSVPKKASALTYLESQAWEEVIREEDQEPDHSQLLRTIFQHVLRVSTPADGIQDRTVAQLIEIGFSEFSTSSLNLRVAREALSVIGIWLSDTGKKAIYISPRHRGIERILSGTPWASNYASILQRAPGIRQSEPRQITDLDGQKKTRRLVVIPAEDLTLNEFQNPPEATAEAAEDSAWWIQEGF